MREDMFPEESNENYGSIEKTRELIRGALNKENRREEEMLITMIKDLKSIDSNNMEDILNWVCFFQKEGFPKDLISNYKNEIIDVFAEKRLYPNLHSTSEIPKSGSFESGKILVEINLYMFRQIGSMSSSFGMDVNFWTNNRQNR